MAEWPKKLGYDEAGDIEGTIDPLPQIDPSAYVEVIPADLGRELYEALTKVGPQEPYSPERYAALVHYEREVGLMTKYKEKEDQ